MEQDTDAVSYTHLDVYKRQNTKRFVRCFWGLDKSLAYARHFPAIHWLTSYSEYLNDLSGWYSDQMCIRDRYSIAIVNTYLFLKEEEIYKLTTALECIRYGLTKGETLGYLGGVNQ